MPRCGRLLARLLTCALVCPCLRARGVTRYQVTVDGIDATVAMNNSNITGKWTARLHRTLLAGDVHAPAALRWHTQTKSIECQKYARSNAPTPDEAPIHPTNQLTRCSGVASGVAKALRCGSSVTSR